MVVSKGWLSELRLGGVPEDGGGLEADKEGMLGVLAFEVAATMSRLVSLYWTLSEQEVLKLRSDTMRSQGVAYLISTNQLHLLRLASAEILDDLDRAAAVVSFLGIRCREHFVQVFQRVYSDLKAGAAPLDRLVLSCSKKVVEKKVRKMEKYIAATSKLCEEMEALGEMEAAERRMGLQWSRYSGPIPAQLKPYDSGDLTAEIKLKRQRVKKLKEESLWFQSFDAALTLTARTVCTVFARVCVVFGSIVHGLPPVITNKENSRISFVRSRIRPLFPFKFSSGPMERPPPAARMEMPVSNSCPILNRTRDTDESSWVKMMEAPASTVGGSGLALRYAEVIALAERVLEVRSGDDEEELKEEAAAREDIYRMLPAGLRAAVKGKLRGSWRDPGPWDGDLAAGWREAVAAIMVWLWPVARDTLRWQAERSMDRRQRFDARPRALMLQTLHFANKEKTEAAIVEVLVGLSCVCWYDERRRQSMRAI